MRNCDIIIPVFNAFDHLEKCMESLLIHTDLESNRLIMLDDKSDDERIIPFIEDFISRKKKNILLKKNEYNLGFVKTVNIGMKLSGNDVLLLNPCTEVTERWLDKMQCCAYSKDRIATVTPLSNNAGIVSVPVYNKENDLPAGYDLNGFQSFIENVSYRDYVDIPKGVCFCLYIKREALDSVGFFGEESFGIGYSETDIFFYRCLDHGFRHVLCDDVFIYHEGSQSFSGYYRQKNEESKNVPEEKYSFYKLNAEKWELCHPVNYVNKNIILNLCINNGKSNILVIIHLWELIPGSYKTIGGTSLNAFDIIQKLKGKYNFHVLFPCNGMYRLCSYWETGSETIDISSNVSQYHIDDYYNSEYSLMLDEIMDIFKIDIIHIHHMIGHYFDIVDIAKARKVRMIISLHDLYCVCPRINKINCNNLYCGNPDDKECDLCLASYVNDNYNLKNIKTIKTWEKVWSLLFSLADKIIAPSEAARNEILQRHKNIAIDVVEHGIDIHCEKRELDIDADKEYHIAFVGFLTAIKGKDIIERLIDYSHMLSINVIFHLFGYMDSNILQMDYCNFYYHGKYDRKDLNKLFIKNNIKLVCIFSIWPETFCYTLSESAANNIPILAIEAGAVGQRVRENNLGWLIKNGTDIPEIYKKIMDIFNDKEGYRKVSKSVSNYKIKNVDEMCIEYDMIYSAYRIDSKENGNTEKIKRFIKDNYNMTEIINPLIDSERHLKGELRNKTKHIEQLIESERQINGELQNTKGELQNKNIHVEQLILSERKLNAEISAILSSGSWKVVSRIFLFTDRLFPPNSKRRLFVKNIFVFIKHPVKYIKKCIYK